MTLARLRSTQQKAHFRVEARTLSQYHVESMKDLWRLYLGQAGLDWTPFYEIALISESDRSGSESVNAVPWATNIVGLS